jgi:hypothetical protein
LLTPTAILYVERTGRLPDLPMRQILRNAYSHIVVNICVYSQKDMASGIDGYTVLASMQCYSTFSAESPSPAGYAACCHMYDETVPGKNFRRSRSKVQIFGVHPSHNTFAHISS